MYYAQDEPSPQALRFKLRDNTDHVTGVEGLTPIMQWMKPGEDFAAGAGAVVERSGGWYEYTPDSGELDTLGEAIFQATATGVDMWEEKVWITALGFLGAANPAGVSLALSCPDRVEFGQKLLFGLRITNPLTGAVATPAAPPQYRIYEGGITAVPPFATGYMVQLDSPTVTGAFAELLDITVAEGFTLGKTYLITVDVGIGGKLVGSTASFRVDAIETILHHKRMQDISTGVQQFYDESGSDVIVTVTPSEVSGTIELIAS
jgi:hypothetical protein